MDLSTSLRLVPVSLDKILVDFFSLVFVDRHLDADYLLFQFKSLVQTINDKPTWSAYHLNFLYKSALLLLSKLPLAIESEGVVVGLIFSNALRWLLQHCCTGDVKAYSLIDALCRSDFSNWELENSEKTSYCDSKLQSGDFEAFFSFTSVVKFANEDQKIEWFELLTELLFDTRATAKFSVKQMEISYQQAFCEAYFQFVRDICTCLQGNVRITLAIFGYISATREWNSFPGESRQNSIKSLQEAPADLRFSLHTALNLLTETLKMLEDFLQKPRNEFHTRIFFLLPRKRMQSGAVAENVLAVCTLLLRFSYPRKGSLYATIDALVGVADPSFLEENDAEQILNAYLTFLHLVSAFDPVVSAVKISDLLKFLLLTYSAQRASLAKKQPPKFLLNAAKISDEYIAAEEQERIRALQPRMIRSLRKTIELIGDLLDCFSAGSNWEAVKEILSESFFSLCRHDSQVAGELKNFAIKIFAGVVDRIPPNSALVTILAANALPIFKMTIRVRFAERLNTQAVVDPLFQLSLESWMSAIRFVSFIIAKQGDLGACQTHARSFLPSYVWIARPENSADSRTISYLVALYMRDTFDYKAEMNVCFLLLFFDHECRESYQKYIEAFGSTPFMEVFRSTEFTADLFASFCQLVSMVVRKNFRGTLAGCEEMQSYLKGVCSLICSILAHLRLENSHGQAQCIAPLVESLFNVGLSAEGSQFFSSEGGSLEDLLCAQKIASHYYCDILSFLWKFFPRFSPIAQSFVFLYLQSGLEKAFSVLDADSLPPASSDFASFLLDLAFALISRNFLTLAFSSLRVVRALILDLGVSVDLSQVVETISRYKVNQVILDQLFHIVAVGSQMPHMQAVFPAAMSFLEVLSANQSESVFTPEIQPLPQLPWEFPTWLLPQLPPTSGSFSQGVLLLLTTIHAHTRDAKLRQAVYQKFELINFSLLKQQLSAGAFFANFSESYRLLHPMRKEVLLPDEFLGCALG